ncbi:hypothetical protein GCM10007887_25440 [Methylobacterium haplocladii]|uniref:Uncharacterized protein n=1 Tax=Methylobacterium haplocladii TaxID=1176176 RepID=A0A512IQN6_9HYPH|nr:hypothetical protein MHA02_24140 [Methylobacterium haplocladii]GJD85743.1 hypothetical protein HPGCJGGD_3635 [Methylobacterium haplocladii]GLS59871.1 hypothetical protein GCM10007887_25440 [Methylobacterium haplocladii]
MAQNNRTPAGANGEGSGKMSGLAADTFQLALAPREIQMARILSRFAFSPALAAAVADLVYSSIETGRRL